MRFLIDMPLTPKLVGHLAALGHEAVHALQIGRSRAADSVLLEQAATEGRIVITADLDFSRLMTLTPRTSPGVILLRGGSYTDAEMIELVERALNTVDQSLLHRSFVVVDQRRVRRRQLPI